MKKSKIFKNFIFKKRKSFNEAYRYVVPGIKAVDFPENFPKKSNDFQWFSIDTQRLPTTHTPRPTAEMMPILAFFLCLQFLKTIPHATGFFCWEMFVMVQNPNLPFFARGKKKFSEKKFTEKWSNLRFREFWRNEKIKIRTRPVSFPMRPRRP